MLLRSSSTPIRGSLLSSLAETPNRDFDTSNNNNKSPSSNTDHHHKKISFLHGGQSTFSSFSCNSSPFTGVSDSDQEPNTKSLGGFRRALSDGNLEGLVAVSDMDELYGYKPPLRSSRKSHHSTLQTILSFSIYNSTNGYREEGEEEDEEEEEEEGWGGELSLKNGFLKRSITIGDNINGEGSGEFSFGKTMDLIKEEEDMMMNEIQGFSINDEEGQPKSPPMYLAMGLGLDIGFGKAEDGGDYSLLEYQDDGHRNKSDAEEYYKRMVEDDPGNPLLLRNYAQFLYQVQDSQTGQTLGIGRKVGRMFELTHLHIPNQSPSISAAISTPSTSPISLWHSRLGHMSIGRLRSLVSSGHLGSVKVDDVTCLFCKLGKQPALSFNNSDSHASAPFDLIHSDVWGPSPTSTMGGCRYFVIFIDDYSRFTWIYLMKNRSELPKIYFQFAQMIQTQFSLPIKIFRVDNAMEYKESTFLNFLRQQGTISQYSCPGTSPQNGRAERKHRHILDTVRTLLIASSCPERFWGEAALTAVYTINRTPMPIINNQSPYECLHKISPDYNLLKVFGCVCFVSLQTHEHSKLQPLTRLCCFLGYGIEHKGYRCWDPISKRLRISRHVTFWEDIMFSSLSKFHTLSSSTPFFTDTTIDIFPDDLDTPSPPTTITPPPLTEPSPEPQPTNSMDPAPLPELRTIDSPTGSTASDDSNPDIPLRRSTRVIELPKHLRDYHVFSTILSYHEPKSYREASAYPHWQATMNDELQALDRAHTWDLVDLPPGKNAIGCKWIYKIKTRSDGSIDRYKARLVAKGFTQEYGIDYEETFAPVARLTSVRSLLAVAAARKWKLFQMDVKNTFLNGDLLEEVYMKPPPGHSHSSTQVCRLRRALYGLKQAPRAWFEKFSSTVKNLGFTSSPYDSGLFSRKTKSGTILLLLYVDDMIITGDDLGSISRIKLSLSQSFQMKDLGQLSYFLGLEVLSDSSGYYLSQAKYSSDILARAGLTDCKIASTPTEPNIRLTALDGTLLSDATLYRQLVGSLVYLAVTRPDIAYAVHSVSQFLSAPRSTHYDAVIRILRYIKGTMFHGLYFPSHNSLKLCAYSDADWAGDPTDRRSTTGFCFFLGNSLISWRSKKQSVVSRSTTEAEYRALADTSQELRWLRWLLEDMGVSHTSATSLYCDNQSALQIAHNDVFHERTKHIEIDWHFVRQFVVQGVIHLKSVSSEEQIADVFTKAQPPGRFQDSVIKLKLANTQPS